MNKISYRRHRFPAEIIQRAVWLCFRFPLSYRDVEDLLAERGVDVSYETIRRWALKLAQFAESYVFVIECLERQEVGSWTARVSRCGFRRRAG